MGQHFNPSPELVTSRCLVTLTIWLFIYPRYIAKVNPRTETPVIAVVVSGTFSAILALCFNLDFFLEMTAISTLMAYTTVAVCVMVLRYRPETVGLVNQDDHPEEGAVAQTDHNTTVEDSPLLGVRQAQQPSERTAFLAIVAIVVSSLSFVALGVLFVSGSHHLAMAKWWAILILILGSLLIVCCALLLLWLPQNKTPLRFTVPFVPVLPLLTVFINLFLILKLPYMTWIRFSVWMITGEYADLSLVTQTHVNSLSSLTCSYSNPSWRNGANYRGTWSPLRVLVHFLCHAGKREIPKFEEFSWQREQTSMNRLFSLFASLEDYKIVRQQYAIFQNVKLNEGNCFDFTKKTLSFSGLSIYLTYGLVNSIEGERQSREIPDEDMISNEAILAILQEWCDMRSRSKIRKVENRTFLGDLLLVRTDQSESPFENVTR